MPRGIYNHKSIPEEIKEKMRKSHLGKKYKERTGHRITSEETRKKISSSNKGKKKSDTARKNMSIARSGKEPWNKGMKGYNSGSSNPSWKGGVTTLQLRIRHHFKYRQWVSDVFTRDDYTCMVSGVKGGKIEAHHIKSFALILEENNIKTIEDALDCEELWNINNGITLSKEIHKDIHKKQ